LSFSDAELGKHNVQEVLDVDRTGYPAETLGGVAKFLGPQLQCLVLRRHSVLERFGGVSQQRNMAGS
jgi:hypothetical protein